MLTYPVDQILFRRYREQGINGVKRIFINLHEFRNAASLLLKYIDD